MMLTPTSRERLAALGIDVWLRRDRRVAHRQPEQPATGPAAVPVAQPAAPAAAAPRVRMASGSGDWLLVQDAPWDGRHDLLLGDIQATIGSARCRFGQWADSESAGVPIDQLDSRGVRHVLVFGSAPVESGLHLAPDLAQLATSGQARRRLWQMLSKALQD